MARDRDKENALRAQLTDGATLHPLDINPDDVRGLLEEIDYLRGEVEAETAYASQLRRQLEGR